MTSSWQLTSLTESLCTRARLPFLQRPTRMCMHHCVVHSCAAKEFLLCAAYAKAMLRVCAATTALFSSHSILQAKLKKSKTFFSVVVPKKSSVPRPAIKVQQWCNKSSCTATTDFSTPPGVHWEKWRNFTRAFDEQMVFAGFCQPLSPSWENRTTSFRLELFSLPRQLQATVPVARDEQVLGPAGDHVPAGPREFPAAYQQG